MRGLGDYFEGSRAVWRQSLCNDLQRPVLMTWGPKDQDPSLLAHGMMHILIAESQGNDAMTAHQTRIFR